MNITMHKGGFQTLITGFSEKLQGKRFIAVRAQKRNEMKKISSNVSCPPQSIIV